MGKTLLVRCIATAVEGQFNRVQFTPDLMPGDILGTDVLEEDRASGRRSFRFLEGPLFANVLLADEKTRPCDAAPSEDGERQALQLAHYLALLGDLDEAEQMARRAAISMPQPIIS